MNINTNANFIEILDVIYREFFLKMQKGTLDIFLCGGASTKKDVSTRDKLKKALEAVNSFRILYPEDLFMDVLNLNKDHNLLFLEQILANNCDCICIVCESMGSLVELGAFTNNLETFPKVIALIQARYKNQKSFIMLGPIKYIQTNNKDNVIFYNSNLGGAQLELIRKLRRFKTEKSPKSINTIVGLHYFILLTLFFFRNVEVLIMIESLKTTISRNGYELSDTDFDVIFRSAMKLLYKERAVEKYCINGVDSYRLTNKGFVMCQNLIIRARVLDKYLLCDRIRLSVLKKAYY